MESHGKIFQGWVEDVEAQARWHCCAAALGDGQLLVAWSLRSMVHHGPSANQQDVQLACFKLAVEALQGQHVMTLLDLLADF